MNTRDIAGPLSTLFSELVDGAPRSAAYILNGGDTGLLRSLERVSAEAASVRTPTGSSIAAHVDHLCYGLSLMNRWRAGEDPWRDADGTASWRNTTVSDGEWRDLRARLERECHAWLDALRKPREVNDVEMNGLVSSVAHLAYHLGAIRQIDAAARGPAAPESGD
jgi:hypothetical protein